MQLHLLGWNASLESAFQSWRAEDPGIIPARVSAEHRERYRLLGEAGEFGAEVTGRLRFTAASPSEFPAVGDWVAARAYPDSTALIHAVLPRTGVFTRKAAGAATQAQVVAANVDGVFVVTAFDHDLNPRRLERYLTLAHESGASPVVVLNKVDLCPAFQERVAETARVASGAPVCAVSAASGAGLETLAPFLAPGRTVAFLGSSGVGKSSLVNRLLGEERLKTAAVREDDGRGRHTTTARELLPLPGGALVIDTPGMRELQLWGDEAGLEAAFQDVEALAAGCRFRDCAHEEEPGCAVLAALAAGTLPRDRYEGWRKLRRELRFLERKQSVRATLDERARWKRIHKSAREIMRRKYGG